MIVRPNDIVRLCLVVVLGILLPGTRARADEAPLLLLVAASAADAAEDAARGFAAETGIETRVVSGATSALVRQIEAGAPGTLLLAASRRWADELEAAGHVSHRSDYLGNALVLVVPRGRASPVRSLADLRRPGIGTVALGDAAVPVGAYAEQALRAAGILEALHEQATVVRGADARKVVAWVASGDADAAVVYATDAAASPDVEIVEHLAGALHEPIVLPLLRLRGGGDDPRADRLEAFLLGDRGRAAFLARGFTAPAGPGAAVASPADDDPERLADRAEAERDAVLLSVRVALVAVVISFVPGVAVAWLLARGRFRGRALVETVVNLPLVLPPVVTGWALLVAFGASSPLGAFLERTLGLRIVFTWRGAALASAVVAFPLMVRAMRVAFADVDRGLEQAARTLGAGRLATFVSVSLPLAKQGVVAGCVLAFARSMGEFGATIMIAGSIPGATRTIPLHLYALLETPGGAAASWRVLAFSVLLSAAALLVAELLVRRKGRSA